MIGRFHVRPPTLSRASSTTTERPARAIVRAALSPARPAPTIATSARVALSPTVAARARGCAPGTPATAAPAAAEPIKVRLVKRDCPTPLTTRHFATKRVSTHLAGHPDRNAPPGNRLRIKQRSIDGLRQRVEVLRQLGLRASDRAPHGQRRNGRWHRHRDRAVLLDASLWQGSGGLVSRPMEQLGRPRQR